MTEHDEYIIALAQAESCNITVEALTKIENGKVEVPIAQHQ